MSRFVTRELSGWGNYPVQTCHVLRPEKLHELSEIVAAPAQPSYISRGLGRAYGDAALNEGAGVVLHERLDRMLDFDPATGVLDCEGGVSFADIIETFLPRGWFLPVSPGTRFVTVGGAIASDLHGKNHHHDGSISCFILDLDLLTGTGETLQCSREQNVDAFWATVGAMGLTGAILRARLQLRRVQSAYVTVDFHKAANLDEALESFAAGDESYRYSVAWIDCLAGGASLGRSVLMRGDHTPASDLPAALREDPLHIRARGKRSVPLYAPSFVLGPRSVRLFNAAFYRRHRNTRRVVTYDSFFYPLDSVHGWNRLYGKRGFLQYQMVIPPDAGRAGLVELLEKLSASRRASFLAVLKTFGVQGDGLLSFPRKGYTLALDLPNTGPDVLEFLRELDQVVLRHGGRVYLAKDACTTPESFAAMYPNLSRFRQIKRRLDPMNRFNSSLARRLQIVEGP